MIFYFFITIVFIAELIIAVTLILHLKKWSKFFCEWNNFLDEAKPKISDIMLALRKISEQMYELAPIIVKNIKKSFTNLLINQLKNLIAGITFWAVKKEVEKRLS